MNTITKCIICHMEIEDEMDVEEQCKNGHPVHGDCLKEWLAHSLQCPLCNTKYTQSLIDKYQGYLDEKDEVQKKELEKQKKQEEAAKIDRVAEKLVFMKFVKEIETLLEEKKYEKALELVNNYPKEDIPIYKERNLLFLDGKINYFRERYDLAISSLFKLVKDKFDYPDAFLYLGKAYEALGLDDKAKWAYDRVDP
ncbi:MAG: RING finger domain-containing protein [Promethearchaeia archaeon]